MRLGQHADRHVQRSHGAGITTIDTRLAGDHALTHDTLLERRESRGDGLDTEARIILGAQQVDGLRLERRQTVLTRHLVTQAIGITDPGGEALLQRLDQHAVELLRHPRPLGTIDLGGERLDPRDGLLHLVMAIEHGAEHLVFQQLLGLRLDHQHGLLGPRHHHVQLGMRQFAVAGIQEVAALLAEADARRAHGAREGHPGDAKRCRGAEQCRDVRVDIALRRHHRADHLHLIHEAFGKQRAHRTVDQA